MTVSAQNTYAYYTASASQTTFAIPFRVLTAGAVKVYLNNVLTAAYTLSATPPFSSGNVIFNSGLSSGDKVAIVRETALDQATDYSANTNFNEQSVEDNFDKLTMIVQDLYRKVGKAFGFSDSQSSGTGLKFAVPQSGDEGKALILSDDRTEVEYSETSLSAIAETLADCQVAQAAAEAAAATATSQATAAAGSATTAATQATAATTQKTAAQTAATLAGDWASKAEDSPVTTGPNKYSAFHWAEKASDFVAQCVTIASNLAATLTGNYIYPSIPSVDGSNQFYLTSGMKARMLASYIAILPTSGVDVTFEVWIKNGTNSSWASQACKLISSTIPIEGLGTGTFDIDHQDGGELKIAYIPAKAAYVIEKIGKAATV